MIAVRRGVADLRPQRVALGPEALVQQNAARPELVVCEYLITEFVDELIEAEVDLEEIDKPVQVEEA